MSAETKKRSPAWYLLPMLLLVGGGVIAHCVVKKDDPKTAKNCLFIGIVLTVLFIGISFGLVATGFVLTIQ